MQYVDEDVNEYDDDEDLPGAERGSGLGVGARGANSEVDANDAKCEVDAVYETSSRSHDAYCEVDAVYETSIRITAAALCGCCRTHLSFILSIYLIYLSIIYVYVRNKVYAPIRVLIVDVEFTG
jgi:hypothetical protein